MMVCMTNNTVIAAGAFESSHTDLSAQYGCRAFLTTVTFPVRGAMIRARRFYRADMPTTGSIELYTLEPANTYCANNAPTTLAHWTFATEDFLRIAREGFSETDRRAFHLVALAECTIPADTAERFANIELA